jgi:hypothetical protein
MPASIKHGRRQVGQTTIIVAAALAFFSMAAPQTVSAQTERVLAKLDRVYVADPSATWFGEWVETRLKAREWLNRPDIRIASSPELVAAVEGDSSAIGLITRGQLDRIHTDDAVAAIQVEKTGLAVCAAIAVNEERIEANFGDFALHGRSIEILATPDTLTIAEALVASHRFTDRMTVRQVKLAEATAAIAAPGSAVAILPVLPHSPIPSDEQTATPRIVDMSEAAAQELGKRGFAIGSYRTSFLQRIPFVQGERTVCDDIVQISAAVNTVTPDSIATSSTGWSVPFAHSDFETRMQEAIGTLMAMWRETASQY